MADELILLNFWPSPFGARVRIALAEKGIGYEYKEENLLRGKSELLLEMNPVHKQIPVLIHSGKPVWESLLIVQYIDEVWSHTSPPLLPSHPYDRSHARFWADYVDKKIFRNGMTMCGIPRGGTKEEAKEELMESFKVLEAELGDKAYFGGESFGFVDLSLIPFSSWFYAYERGGKFNMDSEFPKLVKWAKKCMEKESVSKSVPDPHKVYDFVIELKKKHGYE